MLEGGSTMSGDMRTVVSLLSHVVFVVSLCVECRRLVFCVVLCFVCVSNLILVVEFKECV